MELVEIRNGEVLASSLDVAEYFEKRHADILKAIEILMDDLSKADKSNKYENVNLRFHKSNYKTDNNNKSYPMYYMTKDAFILLTMGFTGKKALGIKISYINAFNQMEQALLNKKNAEWIEKREIGKLARRAETDAIKEFVQYASENGSTHSDRYYLLFTKMVNGIIGAGNGRDFESIEILQNLSVAEKAVTKLVRTEIEKNTEYHEIYKLCKERLIYLSECGLFEINQKQIVG